MQPSLLLQWVQLGLRQSLDSNIIVSRRCKLSESARLLPWLVFSVYSTKIHGTSCTPMGHILSTNTTSTENVKITFFYAKGFLQRQVPIMIYPRVGLLIFFRYATTFLGKNARNKTTDRHEYFLPYVGRSWLVFCWITSVTETWKTLNCRQRINLSFGDWRDKVSFQNLHLNC